MAYINYVVNDSQLKNTLENIAKDVLDIVSDNMLEDFQRHLDNTVYKPEESSYERYYHNGGFFSGWQIERKKDYIRKLMFDGNKLIAPQQDMKNSQMSHGGISGEDIRDMMAAVLNDARYNDYYSYDGGAKYLTDIGEGYWDIYLQSIDKKMNKWLDDAFKKYGIGRR